MEREELMITGTAQTFSHLDPIYYHAQSGDTYPGLVLRVQSNRIKVLLNTLAGDIIRWVSPKNLDKQ
jgi:hypothetical protein